MFVAARALCALLVGSVAVASVACDDDTSPSGSSSGSAGTSSSSSGGSVTLPDACTLLTASEVESLLGGPVAGEPATQTTAGGGLRRCTWERKNEATLRTDELVLSVAPAAAYASSGPSALVGATPFAIGDEGQVLDQPRGVQAAWKKGSLSASYRYSITGAFTDDFEPLRTRAKELAQAANGRM